MSGQVQDYGQSSQYPSRRSSDGAFRPAVPMQYPEIPSAQHPQQHLNQQSHQTTHNSLRNPSPSLPPIRQIRPDRSSTAPDSNYSMPLPYPDNYGYGYGNGYEPEQSQYTSRRMPVYEQIQRGQQTYGDLNSSGHMFPSNQARYVSTYDASRSYGPISGSYMETEYAPHSPHPLNGAPYSNFGVLGDSGDSRSKKRRGNLPKPVTDILRAWFHDHLDHPYPSEDDKQMLIARTGLTISQVCCKANPVPV